jgi:hypothetical protein
VWEVKTFWVVLQGGLKILHNLLLPNELLDLLLRLDVERVFVEHLLLRLLKFTEGAGDGRGSYNFPLLLPLFFPAVVLHPDERFSECSRIIHRVHELGVRFSQLSLQLRVRQELEPDNFRIVFLMLLLLMLSLRLLHLHLLLLLLLLWSSLRLLPGRDGVYHHHVIILHIVGFERARCIREQTTVVIDVL